MKDFIYFRWYELRVEIKLFGIVLNNLDKKDVFPPTQKSLISSQKLYIFKVFTKSVIKIFFRNFALSLDTQTECNFIKVYVDEQCTSKSSSPRTLLKKTSLNFAVTITGKVTPVQLLDNTRKVTIKSV